MRLRLSGLTAAVAFGLGGLALGAVYLLSLHQIRNLTMRALVVTGQPVEVGGRVVVLPQLAETEIRTLESVIKEAILNQVALTTLGVLGVMFVLSIVVGWFVAGRALRPIERIAQVAEEIEATDLSRRIRLEGPEDELTRLARTFDAMLDRLEEAFRSQRRFLAQTSHDLRTPLAVLRTNLDVLLADPEASIEDWRSTAEVSVTAVDRMATMIDDLLAAARLGIGARPLIRLRLDHLAGKVADEMRARIESEGMTLAVRLEETWVNGDEGTLTRAVYNLIDNAVKFSPGGSDLTLGVGSSAEWCYVAVADRGPGLPAEVARGERQAGQGLGLAIVREIASAHRGRLEAVPRRGGGTVVSVWVPLKPGRIPDPPTLDGLALL